MVKERGGRRSAPSSRALSTLCVRRAQPGDLSGIVGTARGVCGQACLERDGGHHPFSLSGLLPSRTSLIRLCKRAQQIRTRFGQRHCQSTIGQPSRLVLKKVPASSLRYGAQNLIRSGHVR